MIRRALASDTTRVVELLADSRRGAGFDSAAGVSGFVFPFEAAYAERLFLLHIVNRNCCALLHDVDGTAQGVLLASFSEHPFGPTWLARETAWWIDPTHRGGTAAVRMLDAYEHWAALNRCTFAGMAGMGDDPDVAVLYRRRGYRTAETHFLKALT